MAVRYEKGTVLTLSVTYEVDVKIKEDGVYTPADMWDLASQALLKADDMDQHVTDCKVVGEVDEDSVSRETTSAEDASEDWEASQAAVRMWDRLRQLKGSAYNPKDYPDLTANQIQFVKDVLDSGFGGELRAYSGRGMFGKHCPGVTLRAGQHAGQLKTSVMLTHDSLGMGIIVYVPC